MTIKLVVWITQKEAGKYQITSGILTISRFVYIATTILQCIPQGKFGILDKNYVFMYVQDVVIIRYLMLHYWNTNHVSKCFKSIYSGSYTFTNIIIITEFSFFSKLPPSVRYLYIFPK